MKTLHEFYNRKGRVRAAHLLLCLAAMLAGSVAIARGAAQSPTIAVTWNSESGEAIPVDGIVCDNLRSTPAELKNHLDLRLPADLADQQASGTVSNSDGTSTDARKQPNTGAVVAGRGGVTYYPPDEFNSTQQPRGVREVDGPATRYVLIKVSARSTSGAIREFPPLKIALARPPVVLVHGINRSQNCWIPLMKASARMKGARGQILEIPYSAVDHYAPASYRGLDLSDRTRYPKGLFFGSGPVEIGADLLAQRIATVRRCVVEGLPFPAMEDRRSNTAPTKFAYRGPNPAVDRPLRLAIRRVDVMGWSYGGVIARWYLSGSNQTAPEDVPAYRGRYSLPGSIERPIDFAPRVPYRNDVRKLITVGSMWRGVPMINYMNEIRFSAPDDPESLARAPIRLPPWMPRSLWKKTGADRTVGSLADAIDIRLPVKTPAMEVMAIDSPWLSKLIYGRSSLASPKQAAPFQIDVAYGSVAGDSSAYLAFGPLSDISPYGAMHFFQKPVRFPFLELERRAGAAEKLSPIIGGRYDYTDGMVPLWSAVIPGDAPGASIIVHAKHDTYFTNADTLQYVCRWLNNSALPTGETLNAQWDSPVVSRDGRKRWEFRSGEMAPGGRMSLYGCIDGVGRILPAALHPHRAIAVRRESEESAAVEWHAPAGGWIRKAVLFERRFATGSGRRPSLKRIRSFAPEPEVHGDRIQLTGLRSQISYYVAIEACIENGPDPPIVYATEPVPIPEKP